jgi:hypothetical protein
LTYKTKELSPSTMTALASRLTTLRTAPTGCIFLMVQDASSGYPIITLVAAPSMATTDTQGSTGDPPGILLADIWVESVLEPFATAVDLDQPHCPLMAASEGFSRATGPATPTTYLDDAQPWLFPAGKQFCEQVPIASSDTTYRAFSCQKSALLSTRFALAHQYQL